MPNIDKILKDLKTRKVFRSLAIYAGFAFVLIQVCDIVIPRLFLPEWTITFIIVLVIIGFPIIAVLSWIYDLKRENKIDDQSEDADVKTDKKWSLTKKILFPVTGFVLMLVGGIFWFIYPFLSISLGDDSEFDASIAILYMENISPEEKSYFADGLTEELINRLSRIQNLQVRLRTDVAVYKDKKISVHEIAKQLNVNYIVEGSVRIINDKLRVNAKLYEIAHNKTLWSDSYERQLVDIFSLQDEIAASIVEKLDDKLNISKKDLDATMRKSTENLEAYNLIIKCYQTFMDIVYISYRQSKLIIPLAEQALELDSTYADAWSMLSLGKILKIKGAPVSEEEIKETIGEAFLFSEKALLYDPDNQMALFLISLFPMLQSMVSNQENLDYFTIRKQKIIIDRLMDKFPGTPLAFTAAGIYYYYRYSLTEEDEDLNFSLDNFLKSHSIHQRSSNIIQNPIQQLAKQQNFETIPIIYSLLGNYDNGYEFLKEINFYKCNDGTYNCLSTAEINRVSDMLYFLYYYDEALEVNKLVLNLIEDKSVVENEDILSAYYIFGAICMKRAEYDKAITGFKNAIKSLDDLKEKNDGTEYVWWDIYLFRLLGLVNYHMGNYDKASEHYLQAYLNSKQIEDERPIWAIMPLCSHAYIEELRGNNQTALKEITECSEWLEQNPDAIDKDFLGLETYWQLYMYYNLKNNSIKTKGYLKLAYESIGIEKIEKYHQHPEKDTHPEYFYCRDIIKEYEASLNQ